MSYRVIQVNEGTSVYVSYLNSREISISPIGDQYEIKDETGKLVGLNYCDELVFKLGEILKIDKRAFKALFIDKEFTASGPTYLLRSQKRLSKTSMFIVPFLGFNRLYFRWNDEFTNAFIGTEANADYGESMYLLYRFDGSMPFIQLEAKLQEHKEYQGTVDVDGHQVIFQFKVPDEHREDVDKILEGKYSTISLKGKTKILDFHQSSSETALGQILSKSEERRKKIEDDLNAGIKGTKIPVPKGQELLDIFDIEEEIFMNKYIIADAETEQRNSQ